MSDRVCRVAAAALRHDVVVLPESESARMDVRNPARASLQVIRLKGISFLLFL